MLSTGIPELQTEDDIVYLRKALCVEDDDYAASKTFKKKIRKALQAKSQVSNHFAVHTLAQNKTDTE